MSGLNPQRKTRRAISATEAEIVALLDRLDAQDNDDDGASKPKEDQFEYRVDSCEVSLLHIGASSEVTFVVPTRTMSPDGMTFLYGGFAHTGSKCRLALVTNNGSSAKVRAVVSDCRYVANWMHEVSVEFNSKIHVASFCRPSPEWKALVVVGDEDEFRQVKHYLTVLRAEVTRAGNADEVIADVASGHFDCMLLELDALDQGGIEIIERLVGGGYEGVILGVGNANDETKSAAALDAGCKQCFEKPYGPELMKAVYEAVRGPAPAG
ncbi:MAG: response regulator [Phycisphaerales bacterium]|nr:response regulator [Phycisphaerae bacterium]NNF43344.1 response regulator [Phycisphaerales bacterium]NNM27736.1 response regulator [Phycisphaerales bacterium]